MGFETIFKDALIALLVALTGIAVKFLISIIKKGVELLTEKINSIKNEDFRNYCKDMMNAAETMTKELLNGTEKKKWVVEKLTAYATEKKIPVTEEQINNLVQSIFQELDGITLNKYKATTNVESIVSETIDQILSNVFVEDTEEVEE